MSIEFEQIQQAFSDKEKKIAAEKQAIAANEVRRQKELVQAAEKEKLDSENRTIENRRILKNSGVVGLFEEIINSGMVKMSNEPIYVEQPKHKGILFSRKNEKVKISDYEPAIIEWGPECETVSLLYNVYSYGYSADGVYSYGSSANGNDYKAHYDRCTFAALPSGKIGHTSYVGSQHEVQTLEIEKGYIPIAISRDLFGI